MIHDMPIGTMNDDQGNTQIPTEIRERLHLKKGDQVEYFVKPDGEIVLRLVPASIEDLRGIFHRPDLPPRSVQQIREDMIEFLAEDNQRIRRGGE
jgi:AbrB family looped-hinge helix DNA binding protein